MFGKKKEDVLRFSENKLPIFVHALQSADAFLLAQRVWEVNKHGLLADPGNKKEFLRFVFTQPACIVWLQRDQGRIDTFELILMWESENEGVAEVYTISSTSEAVGDDSRVKSLLSSILATPAVVPAQAPTPTS